MKRRLQVFVCSTFEDLLLERQAAVEAILKAGHIPAGMELFTAGSETQLEVIRQWIDDSDVFLLILGGRYGSIEPVSGLSYIEVEFDYARKLMKPFFSVVLSEKGLETKVKQAGMSVIEQQNADKLRAFRDKVISQMCAFFSIPQEVKLAIFETLPQFGDKISGGGWVKAAEVTPSEDVAKQLTRLLDENQKLSLQNDQFEKRLTTLAGNAPDYKQLVSTLANEMITIPREVTGEEPREKSLLTLMIGASDQLARGVSNQGQVDKTEAFLFYNVASRLAAFGLMEHVKVPSNAIWQRLKLSKEGIKVVTRAKITLAAKAKEKAIENQDPVNPRTKPAETKHGLKLTPKTKRGRQKPPSKSN